MSARISFLAVGHASSALLAISFTLCVIFDLIFPEQAMFKAWRDFLPGFDWLSWLSWPSFFLGLLESYGYGWYAALIWVPIYNFVAARSGTK